tara:strand:+ start:328 stop:468 length:141 start_codon:yes stop_codon:yes gene_type:complete
MGTVSHNSESKRTLIEDKRFAEFFDWHADDRIAKAQISIGTRIEIT